MSGFAPAFSSISISSMAVVLSSDGRSARPPVGSVFMSTAAYSGARPQVSHLFTSAPRRTSKAAVSKLRLMVASSSGVTRSGSVRFTSAPPSSSSCAHSAQPRRAAYSSGVKPPEGRACLRGSAVTCRSQSFTVERALTSAPCCSSSFTMAGCASAAAHISAVWPRQRSRTFTFAPRLSSSFAASTLLVRAMIIRAVMPSSLDDSTSAPAASSLRITSTLPVTAASDSGVEP